ncbi:kynureninase [Salinivirga cyanobacteriivorans]
MDIFSAKYAQEFDERDPLKPYRIKFELNDADLIYLDGNSLGALPKATPDRIKQVIDKEWGDRLIRSWNEGWYDRSQKIGAKIAQLIGAQPDEVIVADSTSVNLFKLAYGALKLQKGRSKIISDQLNFPSDIYLLQGLIDLFGQKHKLELAKSSDGMSISNEEIEALLDDDTALVTLSHVVFKSAYMYDMKTITERVHEHGGLMLWDLSHAVGAVPVNLNACNVDMAIGCTYKYLNGGPGSLAFLYVRKDLQEKLNSPIWGWFGEDNPFEFGLDYRPAQGIRKFLAGTPPVLSLTAIEPAVDMLNEAGMNNIREKSLSLTNYLIALFYEVLQPLGYRLGTPTDPAYRGSHVSLKHQEAYRICKALIDKNVLGKSVIPDFREPDNIRLGITPLYTTFSEIFEATVQLQRIVKEKLYTQFSTARDEVT